jgi:ribonuclease P protein subunit RPR2
MAKAKTSKGAGSVPNKALHSRVSFLYQAAAYLATQQQHSKTTVRSPSGQAEQTTVAAANDSEALANSTFKPVSRRLVSDLRSVSLKIQMRMSPAMKRAICKSCDTMLIDRSTCSSEVENKSKGGKKPWADVLVRKCNTCGFEKRFPMRSERQKRRPARLPKDNIPENNKMGALEEG